jgi:Ca-activated chloride channel family protein
MTENFFLAMVEPPKSVPSASISPRDYIFVVDISGSMHGFPLDTAKAMLRRTDWRPAPQRHLQCACCSAGSNEISVNPHSVRHPGQYRAGPAHHRSSYKGGGGSTELIPALQAASMPSPNQKMLRAPWWW